MVAESSRPAFARSASVRGLLVLALLATSCADRPLPDGAGHGSAVAAGAGEWFTDRAQESGLDFVHFNGMTGRFRFPEVIPPGVGLFDYDADGDLDVFLAQGQMLGKEPLTEALHPPLGPLKSRLFRNDLDVHSDGTRTLRFVDVTDASGIAVHGYAMGAATGDFNNDGCVDLYVTNLERSQLFRNGCSGFASACSIVFVPSIRPWGTNRSRSPSLS